MRADLQTKVLQLFVKAPQCQDLGLNLTDQSKVQYKHWTKRLYQLMWWH